VVDNFQKQYSRDEAVFIAYNVGDAEFFTRSGYYNIAGVPTVCGDGLSDVWPVSDSNLADDLSAHSAGTSPLKMSVYETGQGAFAVDIYADQDVTDAFFVMAAVEDDVVPAYGGQQSHLPYHWRVFMTAPTGDAFSLAAGETTRIERSFVIDPAWEYKTMGVVCWVQKDGGTNPSPEGDIPRKHQVLQAAYAPSGTASVPAEAPGGAALALAPPSPNPSGGECRLRFEMPVAGRVRLTIYDVAGRVVRRLYDGRAEEGPVQVSWDGLSGSGERCAAGIYLAGLEGLGGARASRKVVRLK